MACSEAHPSPDRKGLKKLLVNMTDGTLTGRRRATYQILACDGRKMRLEIGGRTRI